MTKIHRPALLALAFIAAFFATIGLISVFRASVAQRVKNQDREEARILQEEMKERFNLFLEVSKVMGQIAAKYLAEVPKGGENYGHLVEEVFAENEYFLGLNGVSSQGQIDTIYPKKSNLGAHGKISQNFEAIRESVNEGEKYWFSPPFKLFQGTHGFVIYVPIYRKGKFDGWIAPVIGSQIFFERFRAMDFFKTFELVIKDAATGQPYFATAEGPEDLEVYTTTASTKGRDLVLTSWRKREKELVLWPRYWDIIIAALAGLLIVFSTRLLLSRREVLHRLESISKLLRLTSREAHHRLVDLHSDQQKDDMVSITNLIEQIDLLQSMAETGEVEDEEIFVLPELTALIVDSEEMLGKKRLRINLIPEGLNELRITGNRWLFRNTVLRNVFTNCILYSIEGKEIFISRDGEGLCFHCPEVSRREQDPFKIERRLQVAKNSMQLMKGDLQLKEDEGQGMKLRLLFGLA